MNLSYRQGGIGDVEKLKQLAVMAWSPLRYIPLKSWSTRDACMKI